MLDNFYMRTLSIYVHVICNITSPTPAKKVVLIALHMQSPKTLQLENVLPHILKYTDTHQYADDLY